MVSPFRSRVVIADEILNEFIELFENARESQFSIGDRLIDLVTRGGVDKSELINYIAGQLRISASTLYDYYRISDRWTPAYRDIYQSLDWTIYRNADPIEDADLLNQCIDEGWNASRFKEEKFPAMKEPENVVGRLCGLIKKYRDSFSPSKQEQIDKIIDLLNDLVRSF